jgi:beta-lactamase regulating signal transducer with metallopeptidase domain
MVGIVITAMVSAIIMILVVLLIRYVAGKQISKLAFMLIWGIITLRLLIPVRLTSNISVWNLINTPIHAESQMLSAVPLGYDTVHGLNWINILLGIWLIGAIVFGLYFYIMHIRFRKSIRDAVPVTNEYVLEWQKYNSTFRPIKIKQSDRISSPLTFGVLKPTIVLPDIIELYEEEELKHILAHEYVHIRRFDYAIKIILAATLSIHWFNPFVWLMYILANRDIELSCDEVVLKALDRKSSANYAMTLINAADSQNQLAMLHSGFAKHALEERVKAILDRKKKSNIGATIAVVLTVVTLFVFAAPVADAINKYLVRLTDDGRIFINGQEIDLNDHMNEHGTAIIAMPGADVD